MNRMTRGDFLKRLGAGAAALAGAGALGHFNQAFGQGASKPNILFVYADDLGWGDLHCYGHGRIKTPNLDRLAAQGTRFTNFYTSSPVCSPSRAGILTGKCPDRVRIHGHLASAEKNAERGMPNHLDPAVPTFPRLLQGAGYTTAHVGKWHLGNIDAGEYGFDHYRASNGGGNAYKWGEHFRRESTTRFVDDTIDFLKEHKEKRTDEPFYCQTWLLHPHATLDPTEETMKPYMKFTDRDVRGKFYAAETVYYSVVSLIDREIGRLLDEMDALGLAEDTIVIFSSDNGPEDIHIRGAGHSGVGSPGPFRGRKRSLYEGGIRTPFIVRWPGHTPAGAVDDTSVITGVDFFPTLCSLAGVPLPQDTLLEGQDMSAALDGRATQRTKPIHWAYRYPVAGWTINKSPFLAMREGRWKVLANPDRSRIELYDVVADPSEVDDKADEHPDIAKRMADELIAWHESLPRNPIPRWAGSNAYPWPEPMEPAKD